MSGALLPNITRASLTQPLWQPFGTGGGGGITSTVQQFYTSSLTCSSIVLDNQVLTASPTDLLLNGVPLVTSSNISSLSQWALDPAIANVDMAGNDLLNANVVEAGQVITLLANTQELYTSSIFASTIVANNFIALSTIQTNNYLSTNNVIADTVEAVTSVSTKSLFVSSINGSVFPQVIPPPAPAGNISSLQGYDTYFIYSSSFQDDQIQFNLANNYIQQIWLSDGSNTTRMESGTAGLIFEAFYLQTTPTVATGALPVTFSALNTAGAAQLVTLDVNTSSFLVSCVNGIISEKATFSNLYSTNHLNSNWISTPELFVSSINGAEFTGGNGGGIVVSSLVTASISSIVGDVSLQLVSTLSFSASLGSNSFSLGGIDLGLGNIFGQITGGALGIMSLVTSGVALGTGVAALHQTRGTKNINTTNYELVNGTTQLQISTIPDYVSTVYRFSSGNPPDQEVGAEYFISTISPPGTFLRSMSDPLNTVSTPQSTLQAFGQWVPLPIPMMSSIADWAFEPALSNVDVNSFDVTNANAVYTDNLVTEFISSSSGTLFIGGNTVGGGANIFFDLSPTNGGLQIDTSPNGNSFMNADIISVDKLQSKNNITIDVQGTNAFTLSNTKLITSTVQVGYSTILTSEKDFPGLAVRQFDDNTIAQVNASAFVVGDPNLTFQGAYSYSIAQDRAAVLNSTLQTKYVAYTEDLQFMSTPSALSTNTISTATLFVSSINNELPFGNKYILSINSSNKQTVLGANTLTPLDQETELINIGGFTNTLSTFTVPVGGIYEIQTSIQFSTSSGGTKTAYFWLMKNGSNVPDSASIVSITNNGETLGNISLLDNATAGDQYTIAIESADANMAATSFAAGGNVPAIPSVITNVKKVN